MTKNGRKLPTFGQIDVIEKSITNFVPEPQTYIASVIKSYKNASMMCS